MRFITIDKINISYEIHIEKEEWFDKNGDPGTPGSVYVEIHEPEELVDDQYFTEKILEYHGRSET